jgi:hypothetical protein
MTSSLAEIAKIKDIVSENFIIPEYQRPYKWSVDSTLQLFNDLYSAYKNNLEEYRIGSIILHFENGKLNIVDGQQRLTTISILLYCFNEDEKSNFFPSLMTEKNLFNNLSSKAIKNNYQILNKKCNSLIDDDKKYFYDYILNRCTFVKIVTDNIQEAFQFFDSQNSRGKPLAPHDLLKAYHLREMKNENEKEKKEIIDTWENTNQKELKDLFEMNLFPLVNYYKKQSALYYSVKDINIFKGILNSNVYDYSIYLKSANLYIEELNSQGVDELFCNKKINQFQLTQPIIAGKRFFLFTLHYFNVKKSVESLVNDFLEKKKIGDSYVQGNGNEYIKNLFLNICIFFVDRFNLEALTTQYLEFFFKWSYSLRLVMYAVYPETINKYALNLHERLIQDTNLFYKISEMQTPIELETVILKNIDESMLENYKTTKYKSLYNMIFEGKS